MPFDRPSSDDLYTFISANWQAAYPGADLNLAVSADKAAVAAIAGMSDEDLAYLDWQARQLFPFSNDTEYLERWCALKGIQRKGATSATVMVSLSAVPTTSFAPAGTQMQTSGGFAVTLVADLTVDGTGTAVVAFLAAVGKTGSLTPGTILTFIGTPSGFADTGTVQSSDGKGADAENDASLRLRFMNALAEPSYGGNQDDWANATLALPGVTAVFIAAATPTPGAVTIYPLFDATRTNGIPVGTDAWYRPGTGPSAGQGGAGDQLGVLTGLLPPNGVRPVCANLYVAALGTVPIDISISNLVPSTDPVKAAIAASVASQFLYRRKNGLDFALDWVYQAIANATGVKSFDLVSPTIDTAVANNQIAVPGTIGYP